MFAFIAAIVLVYSSACAAVIATEDAVRPDNPFVLSLVLMVWASPVGAAWLTAELLAPLLSGRRVLNPAHSWWLPRFIRGLIAGGIGVAMAVLFRGWFDGASYDWAIMAGTASVGTALALLVTRRIREDACQSCGYDLRGLTDAAGGRCPECGTPAVVAVDGAAGNQPLRDSCAAS